MQAFAWTNNKEHVPILKINFCYTILYSKRNSQSFAILSGSWLYGFVLAALTIYKLLHDITFCQARINFLSLLSNKI